MQQIEQDQQKEQIITQNEMPDLIINPQEFLNNSKKQIDHYKLIQSFGYQRIEQSHLDRIQSLSQKPIHHYLKRGIFFSHIDLNQVLAAYEAGKGFYLYTGLKQHLKNIKDMDMRMLKTLQHVDSMSIKHSFSEVPNMQVTYIITFVNSYLPQSIHN